jgi:hypothetical protein
VRLLRSALAERELSLEAAIRLVEYHVERTRSPGSHDKAWLAKHEDVKSCCCRTSPHLGESAPSEIENQVGAIANQRVAFTRRRVT